MPKQSNQLLINTFNKFLTKQITINNILFKLTCFKIKLATCLPAPILFTYI